MSEVELIWALLKRMWGKENNKVLKAAKRVSDEGKNMAITFVQAIKDGRLQKRTRDAVESVGEGVTEEFR